MTMFSLHLRDVNQDNRFTLVGFRSALQWTVFRSGILDVLGDYLTAMTGVFSYGGRRPSQNVYLG